MTLPVIDISKIFSPPTIDDVREIERQLLMTDENPVTDWSSGAVLRTMFELEAYVIQDFVANFLNDLFANGYPTDSSDADPGSQTMVAHGWYAVERDEGGFAQQTITLACDAQHGPFPIAVGRLYEASDGSVYTGLGGGTLNTSSTLTIDVLATTKGALRAMVTALSEQLPGVTVQAAAVKVISSVPQFGADPETNAALFARTDTRFDDPTVPPAGAAANDRVVNWILAAGTSTTRIRFDPSTTVPSGVVVTLANGTGGIPGGEVTTVQAYLDARRFDYLLAQAATNAAVTAGGTVLYPRDWTAAQLTAAQNAADAQWQGFLGQSKIGAKVPLSRLVQAVMDQGVVDFIGETLNGSAIDLVLGSTQVPNAAGSLAAELAWQPF